MSTDNAVEMVETSQVTFEINDRKPTVNSGGDLPTIGENENILR